MSLVSGCRAELTPFVSLTVFSVRPDDSDSETPGKGRVSSDRAGVLSEPQGNGE